MKNSLKYDLMITEDISNSNTRATLPLWLDNQIFDILGAKYCRSNSDMTVIDWDKSDVLNYLGTYFPRSYAESCCIFGDYFKNHESNMASKKEITIFDFGCGTGGEIIGLLSVLIERYKNLKRINIIALDGNQHSLRLYENVLAKFQSQTKIHVKSRVVPIVIDDFYDLKILEKIISFQFDIIISFKAICEFVTKQRFEQSNPYEHIAKTFLPKLTDDGIMLIVDITTYSDVSQEWLPQMMDIGLNNSNCNIISKNSGYNQNFLVSHSRKQNDVSKVAWRLIENSK